MEVTFYPSVWRTAIPVSSSSWAEDLPSCCWRPPGSMMVSHMSLRPDEQEEPGNLCLIMKRRSLVQARYIIYEAVYSACKKGDVIDKNVQYYANTQIHLPKFPFKWGYIWYWFLLQNIYFLVLINKFLTVYEYQLLFTVMYNL